MKIFLKTLLLACCAFASAGNVSAARHVILITIDGGAAFHLDNPQLALPNLRKMIAEGAWADGGSETVFPSVTHTSHTSIITGLLPLRHGDLENRLYDRRSGVIHPPNSLLHSEAVQAKTLFDTAKQKHLITAAVFWPETVLDPSIDYNLMLRTADRHEILIENSWTAELRKDGVPLDFYNRTLAREASADLFDPLNTLAVCDVIGKHKPDLLAIHLVTVDEKEHATGPSSPSTASALEDADSYIGRIVEATKKAGMYADTTFIVTADHGFAAVRYTMNIRPYFIAHDLAGKIEILHEGWTPFLHLLPAFDPREDPPKLRAAIAALKENVHILRVYSSDDYPSIGLPRYEDNPRISGQFMIVSDIDTYLVDHEGASTALTPRERPAFSHGYLPQYPEMYPLLVLFGSGIRKGVRLGHVHQIDIAPTVTELLDLPKLNFDGQTLRAALSAQ